MGFTVPRLIAFGCSFSYGQYLDDPATQAWPSVLGKMLDIPVVNNGEPGASNLEILTNILKFKFKPHDLVVVGWTIIYRDIIYNRWSKNTRIGSWVDQEKFGVWGSLHNDYDLAVRAGLQINHSSLYLESLGLTQYNFFAVDMFNKKPIWIKKPVNWINKSIIPDKDIANDGMHPGILSHNAAANNLYSIIHER